MPSFTNVASYICLPARERGLGRRTRCDLLRLISCDWSINVSRAHCLG